MNTRLLLPDGLEGIGRFSVEILRRMVRNHPEVNFHFFFDRKFDERYLFGPNVVPHVLFPPARHPFLYIGFFDFAVPLALKRVKADVFFSPDAYLSTRTRVPQVPVFHDIAFEHFPEDVSGLAAWHYRRYFPRYARLAERIIAVSEYTREDVVQHYGVAREKFEVVYNACADHFFPLSEDGSAGVREQFAAGKPFFHCVSAIQPRKNLSHLIEAFGQFKAKYGTDHQLLIVGRKAWNFDQVVRSYESSAYRSAIHFTGYVSDVDLNRIYNASSGLTYVPYFEGFGLPIVEAMHCDTPVITSKVSSMPEVAGDAALLVDPGDPMAIAEAMGRLATEEGLAAGLVQAARHRRTAFSWEKSACKVWDVLSSIDL